MSIRASLFKSLILALAVALIPVVAVSAQKITAGSSCKVHKQKVTYQNKVYTCTKSGKKLIWDKGVVVKKPIPTPTPTPSPSPSPSPTPAPTPTPTPIIEREAWEFTYLKIWDELEKAQNQGSFPFDYKLSPNVNQEKAKLCRKGPNCK
jgi:hypothetical protein